MEKSRKGGSRPEDDWFAKHEEELLRQSRRQRERERQQAEAERDRALREAHWMKCPKCGHDLREEPIGPVTIDRCDRCGGIFLDRGELEEMLLRRASERRGFFRRLLGFGDD